MNVNCACIEYDLLDGECLGRDLVGRGHGSARDANVRANWALECAL